MTVRSKKGFSVTEFVVITPVLLMIWMGLMQVNEDIELHTTQLIATRNFAKSLTPNAYTNDPAKMVFVDKADRPQDPQNQNSAKVKALKSFANLDSFVFALNKSEENIMSLFGNSHSGFRYNFKLKFQNRFDKSDYARMKDFYKSPSILSGSYAGLSAVEGAAPLATSAVLDLFKARKLPDGVPLFIDDTKSTIETRVDIRVPRLQGAWDFALEQLYGMNSSPVKPGVLANDRFAASTTYFGETETGYHAYQYNFAPLVGLGLNLAVPEAKHWNNCKSRKDSTRVSGSSLTGASAPCQRAKGILPWNEQLKGNYSRNCPWHMFVGDYCEYGFSANSYHSLVFVLAKIVGVVRLVAMVVSLGSSTSADEAAIELSREAQRQITGNLANAIEGQIQGRLLNAAGDSIDKQLESLQGRITDTAEQVIRDGQKGLQAIEGEAKAAKNNPILQGVLYE